ncbi:MAG: BrnT family toxin [Bdellovibrionota bacterium]
MLVVWDEAKAIGNLKKHGVDFAEAVRVLDDPNSLVFEDFRHSEQRFVTVGLSNKDHLLFVVSCYRGEDQIRIISARHVTPAERILYEERV